jgi:hypothetical protein
MPLLARGFADGSNRDELAKVCIESTGHRYDNMRMENEELCGEFGAKYRKVGCRNENPYQLVKITFIDGVTGTFYLALIGLPSH